MSEQVDLSPGSPERGRLDYLGNDELTGDYTSLIVETVIFQAILARMDAAEKKVSEGDFAALGLIADIRAAIGDPTGKLMQDELVRLVAATKAEADAWRNAGDANAIEWLTTVGEYVGHHEASENKPYRLAVFKAEGVRDELMKGLVTK